ncbi:phosphatidylethanolamine-binding protein [Stenotrophomonas koreensis]|jgi:Raf kinase inhibitor-like YbhB/YbcL family protein|uniref:Phosphatidylethanolamine-binding protein n=1 Tax=Stenotrophomonas koreensis TaxID=266128 RepID=A0A0R0BMN1_9GAMM|nr:YbhB/YbcL family Raf kinase inhibitor-like protein [Stenotrophomonas koreensis]KRG58357.1 phosphatidylethanolamine-binding protein [Stenotrophomonas koreensis]
MRLTSSSFDNGQPLPVALAAGKADGFSSNRNPQLAWEQVPEGTASFVLLCVDPDVPTVPSMVGAEGVIIPQEQPRCDFSHWVMVDIPADVREIAEGACSDGFVVGGKQAPAGPAGARQGINDYTGWFAGDATMAGTYRGYDGAYPPANDARVHRYFFRLFALDIATLPVDGDFSAAQVQAAMQGHVLAEAAIHGTYTLNPAL